jgi:hypothetical protein
MANTMQLPEALLVERLSERLLLEINGASKLTLEVTAALNQSIFIFLYKHAK